MGEWIIEDRYMDDVFMVSGWMDRWMDAGWVMSRCVLLNE